MKTFSLLNMKSVVCFAVLLTFASYQCSCSKSITEYTQMVFDGTDREYGPITDEICKNRTDLKNCYLYKHDRAKLRMYSQFYFNPSENYWTGGEEKPSAMSTHLDDIMRKSGRIVLSRATSRKRRSTEVLQRILRRSKRDIPGNPCQRGGAKRTTILYGIDAELGNVVQLFQNPELNLYQTFFTQRCHMRTFFSFNCDITYVKYMTAVYEKDSLNVITRPVKIPTGCALSVEFIG